MQPGSSEEAMIRLPNGLQLFDTGIYVRFSREETIFGSPRSPESSSALS